MCFHRFELTNVEGTQLALYNKAYCSKFHPTYNANAEADAKEPSR